MMQAMSDESVMFNFWPYNFNKADSLQFALDFSPACDSWNCILCLVVYVIIPNELRLEKWLSGMWIS
jgi:hypothetical protein